MLDFRQAAVDRIEGGGAAAAAAAYAVRAARQAQVPVVFVVAEVRAAGAPDRGDDLHPEVQPDAGEQVMTARRVSAFSGTELHDVLGAGHVDAVVLCGIPTSGVVLATARAAADLGYRVEVLADACADPRPQAHEILAERVLPVSAEVVTASAWATSMVPHLGEGAG